MLISYSALNDIGLSDTETKLYLALLELGPCRAGGIIKKTGLQSSVVHLLLGRLIERGFIAYRKQGRAKEYEAVHPQNILRILDERRKRFENVLPSLIALRRAPEELSADIYEGLGGFKSMLYDLIEEGQTGDEFVFSAFYHTDPEVQREIYPIYSQFEREREQRGFKLKGIVPEAVREHFKERNQRILRYTDLPILLNINVFRNRVSFTPWGERKISFLIRSAQLAEQFRLHFLCIWHELPSAVK